jgi:Kef-type K+ transport system membrane component KefB
VVPLTSAAVIAPVALLSALIVRLARLPVPEIVLQIVLGITIGSQVPDWAHVDASVRVLSLLGLAFLLLLSSMESPGSDICGLRGCKNARGDHRSIAGPLA